MKDPRAIGQFEDFPIKPSDINATLEFMGAFGNMESEISARWIVKLMLQRGDWTPFSYAEINEFYQRTCTGKDPGNFHFNHLIGPFSVFSAATGRVTERLDVIVRRGGEEDVPGRRVQDTDVFQVTDQFICRCYMSAAIIRQKAVRLPATV